MGSRTDLVRAVGQSFENVEARMLCNFFIWIAGDPPRADKSAMGAINRPLPCHAEPFAAAQGKLREASQGASRETLRCGSG